MVATALIAIGLSAVPWMAPQAVAAPTEPVHTVPPDLTKTDDPRGIQVGMPDYHATGTRAGKGRVTGYQYMLPSGRASGIVVYPGVITDAGGALLSGDSWPAVTASGEDAQSFLNRAWADLDEIASNPEGLRLLELMSRASPLPSDISGNEFTDPDDVLARSPVKALIAHADPGGKTATYSLKKQTVGVSLEGTWTGGGIGNSSNVITLADSLPGAYAKDGKLFAMRSATALLHETIHALRSVLSLTPLTGSQALVSAEYPVAVPGTGDALGTPEYDVFKTPLEELITHGGKQGIKAAFGAKAEFGPFDFGIKADPYAAKSVQAAVAMAKARPTETEVQQTLAARQAIAKKAVTELSYVKASKISQPYRPNYDVPNKFERQSFALASGESWGSLTPEDYNDPSASTRLTKSSATASACGAASSADGCGTYGRAATADESKAAWKFDEAEAGGKVSQEPIEQLIVRELPDADFAVYARAVVDQGLTEFQVSAESTPSFTADLAEAWESPSTTFQPFGASTGKPDEPLGELPSSLNEGWSSLNEALTPVMAVAWLESTAQAFSSDATALDKEATLLALVPVVGQLLGIADSAVNQNPAGIAANLLVLLQVVSDLAGQPELAMIFEIGALIAMVVPAIIELVEGSDDETRMIANRDKAWYDMVNKQLKTKTMPALLDAAQKAFDKAQRQVLFGGYVTQVMMDKVAASHPDDSEVKSAVEASKRTVREKTTEAMDGLRTGFVDGVHKGIEATVADLNKGTGSAEFSREYMNKAEKSAYVNEQAGLVCSPLYLDYAECLDNAKGSAARTFQDVFVPKVVANVPTDKFSADDLAGYRQLIDEKIKSESYFTLLMVQDSAGAPDPGPGETVCTGTAPGPVACAERAPDSPTSE
ncbi:hypothetical protein [Streptomyces tubercidicus]